MITKCIHANFELDLSAYEITFTEDNQWFSDRFFTKYTFPIDVELDDDINKKFGQLLDIGVENPVTYYDVVLFIEDGHTQAVLEILEIVDRRASIQLSFGFDEFPNWDKKLAELPLQVLEAGEPLTDHGVDIIDKTWPSVNYNFVQVHTDSFDADGDKWHGFEGIVNKYENGAFVENEFDAAENILYNRNIMIPMPYVMHILQKGFVDAGYALGGDVLTDPELLKMLLYKEAEEYSSGSVEGSEYVSRLDSYDSLVTITYRYAIFNSKKSTRVLALYEDTITFSRRGRYKISGVVYLRRQFSDSKAEIFFKGQSVARYYEDYIRQDSDRWSERVRYVDVNVDVDDISDVVTLTNRTLPQHMVNEVLENDTILWDLTITPLAIYDENGLLAPPVITTQKVDLTKVVPDITFGDFITALKNWKNLDLKIQGNTVVMDYIQPQMEINEVVDLSHHNQRAPRRTFKQGDSYRLMFKEISSDDYEPETVYVDVNGVSYSTTDGNDETNEIEIGAVPLPLELRGNIQTAFAVDDGKSTICAVLYQGSQGIVNLAEDNTEIMLRRVYEKHYSQWLDFRIKSQSFTTNFNAPTSYTNSVEITNKVLMYNKLFLIRTKTRTTIVGTSLSNYELELESLK